MDSASARTYLLALPGITEHDHFGRPAYRTTTSKGKPSNIFMTLWVEDQRAVLMLNVEQQADMNSRHPEAFFPVPNKWGEKGATFVELARVNEKLFRSGLDLAMANVRK
ncbi:MAG: hypothetical protein IPN38_18610 [Flavobacteriales bacterium]|nr:hypothetical protein [Flavobacteriales bacterium]MBL0036488.1 hypothetical protein [Flavobacteriales bacterium]